MSTSAPMRGSKGALYRETLPATGSHVVRIVIASAEFAPMPLACDRATPDCSIPMAIRMRFLRHGGIYQSDVGLEGRPGLGIASRQCPDPDRRACREDHVSLIVPMSSGRLFLDRVARQHCPSPLRRHCQHISVARFGSTIYHQTVGSVLTLCLTLVPIE
jgi:hypothetical protein